MNERDGGLILSENAGAHDELGDWALSVNPFDVAGQAEAIDRALTMPVGERRSRLEAICEHVREHDVAAWIEAQLVADTDRWAAGRQAATAKIAGHDAPGPDRRREDPRSVRPGGATLRAGRSGPGSPVEAVPEPGCGGPAGRGALGALVVRGAPRTARSRGGGAVGCSGRDRLHGDRRDRQAAGRGVHDRGVRLTRHPRVAGANAEHVLRRERSVAQPPSCTSAAGCCTSRSASSASSRRGTSFSIPFTQAATAIAAGNAAVVKPAELTPLSGHGSRRSSDEPALRQVSSGSCRVP